MRICSTNEFVSCCLSIFLFGSCVPHVSITGATCPCPGGFVCCETLSVCIKTKDHCPDVYLPSTQTECDHDHDCPIGEICQSWTNLQGDMLGPRQCRRSCTQAYACADGEVCSPILHDGKWLEDFVVSQACVPEEPLETCQGLSCVDCTSEQMGSMYCDGSEIYGCFFSLHKLCGIVCSKVFVYDCALAGCKQTAVGAECNENVDGDFCTSYSCSNCDPFVPPGTSECSGNQIVSCLQMPYQSIDCDEICYPDIVSCPNDSVCVETNGAHCEG